jgi:hypothetical protein
VKGEKFLQLELFCGGLATLLPGTASVESDFSIVNYEKDQYRAKLTDFSLEGIMHAKQYDLVMSLMKRNTA